MSTIPDLLAQRDALDRQIDEVALPLITSAREILTAERVADLIASLEPIVTALPPGESRAQIGNVLIVLRAVPEILAREAQAATIRLTPIPPLAPPVTPEPTA